MAKKKQELPPEKRLAAALVPEEEQPYELPEGWKWVRIGKIFVDVTDSKKKNQATRVSSRGEVANRRPRADVYWRLFR